jgi:preprotein translocase subunit SecA
VLQALMALHIFARDRDYILREGRVEIVDVNTGRTMKDRSWERGLHQMIEAKEGVAITAPNETIARTSSQTFFPRYLRLCGMSGTIGEVRHELRRVYGLDYATIPTRLPTQRAHLGVAVHETTDAKRRAVAHRAAKVAAQGRAVLIGTRTVHDSEALSAVLTEEGVAHQVLNARQDAEEAEIIAAAGVAGRVTVATNMAGRGTDIALPPPVIAAGGLHVIATERHDSRRIDRQLFGRAARQGDPGSCEEVLSLEDDLPRRFLPAWLRRILTRPGMGWLADLALARAQARADRRAARQRIDLAKHERHLAERLAFAGAGVAHRDVGR